MTPLLLVGFLLMGEHLERDIGIVRGQLETVIPMLKEMSRQTNENTTAIATQTANISSLKEEVRAVHKSTKERLDNGHKVMKTLNDRLIVAEGRIEDFEEREKSVAKKVWDVAKIVIGCLITWAALKMGGG